MRTLLIVVTAAAVLLGLGSWLLWSLPFAILIAVRVAELLALVFLVQGAVLASGREQHFCRGAAIGVTLALLQSAGGHSVWEAPWSLFVTFTYGSIGGWGALRATSWWLRD